MSLARKIAHHTLIQGVSKILSTTLGVVAIALVARYLGPEGYGSFTIITAFLQFFGIIGDLGLSVITIQLLAEKGKEGQHYFNNLVTLRVITSAVLLSCAPLAAMFFPYSPEVKTGIVLMASSFFFSSLIQLFTTPFQARVAMQLPALADVSARAILIGSIWIAIAGNFGLFGIIIAVTLSNVVQCLFLFFVIRHKSPFYLAFDGVIWREILNKTWPIALSLCFNLVYLKADTIILSLTAPEVAVGWYGAAYRVFEVLITFPMMVMGLTLSSFASAWASHNKESFTLYYQKVFDAMSIIAIPLVVGTFILSRPIMLLVAGPSFANSGDILKILILACGLVFFGTLYGHLINVVNAQRKMIIGYAIGAVFGLSGYLVAIPRFSYWGGAWMTVAVEALVALIAAYFFTNATHCYPRWSVFVRAMGASGVMAVVVLAAPPQWHVGFTILLGIVSYAIFIQLFGGISPQLRSTIFSFSRKREGKSERRA